MNNFIYHVPTRVVFGTDTQCQIGELLKPYAYRKVLVHYGIASIINSGLLESVLQSLQDVGIQTIKLGGVVPNPRLSKVYEGIQLCRKEKIDFILAIGGGSTIDSAKAIALGVLDSGDVWDFFIDKRTPEKALPIGSILTLAAAGSETSHSTVITNEEGALKRYCAHDVCIPQIAIMNPELTLTLPDYQSACGCTDILMHTIERYFTKVEPLELTDRISESLLRTVIHNAKLLKSDSQDLKARWEVMWAGSLAHNGLTGCGTDGGDWSTHDLEHELGGMFDIAHGAGLAAIWGSWARYVMDEKIGRFVQFATNVFDILEMDSPKETALSGIVAMEAFYRTIGMPTSIKELGIDLTPAQIDEMAEKCSRDDTQITGSFKPLKKSDIIAIFEMARG